MSFVKASGVVRRGDSSYTGVIQPGWDFAGVSNGGYLMSIAARAMANESGGRDLVSITGYFTNPGRPGPVTIEVERVREGIGFTTIRADMVGNDKLLFTTLAVFADQSRPVDANEIVHGGPPDLPPPEDCIRAVPSSTGPLPPPFMGRVRVMLHPEDAAALAGQRTGIARIRGWFRLNEGEDPDALAVVVAADAFPPAVFNTNLPLKWVPTLDLTIHIRDPQPRGWMKCVFSTRFVTGGLLEEDGEIWDEYGNLVAQSRQLALVPRSTKR